MEYRILTALDAEELATLIEDAVINDWEVQGGVAMCLTAQKEIKYAVLMSRQGSWQGS